MNEIKSKPEGNRKQISTRKPNEVGGVYFSSSVKIFDPNSNEVMVQKRGDS